MKRLLILFMLATVGVVASCAQEHQTFKGVPIDGTVADFAKKLESKGFVSSENDESGNVSLTGVFAGYNNCNVSLLPIPNSDKIYGVKVTITVEMPAVFSEEYQKMKSMLTEKYGEPTTKTENATVEVADSDTVANFDWTGIFDELMKAMRIKTADVQMFESASGTIDLVGYNVAFAGVMVLTYIDKANSKAYRQSVIDDL